MDNSRRPQLPALGYLDVDKVKREEDLYHHQRTTGTPQSLSASAGASPTYHHPPGPPPPYSHAHGAPPTNSWHHSVHTPPESRRTSEYEKESGKPRQSLPSISEALGKVDNQSSFASTTVPPSSLQSAPPSNAQTTAPLSPALRKSYPMEPPQMSASSAYSGSSSYAHHSQYRPEPVRQSSYPPPDSARPAPAAYPPAIETQTSHLPSSHTSSRPPPPTVLSRERSPPYDQQYSANSARSTSSTGPPSSFPYGYTPFPPRYANNATPSTNSSSGPIYQPSTTYGPPETSQTSWKSESTRYDDRALTHHSDTVKRHLDFFDLEASLNEISSTSGILSDFSRRYGDRMHHTQRSGTSLNQLPGLVEVDDMINKSRVAHDSLMKIRDVILQQQAVFEQQAADQRQQHKLYEQHPQPGQDAHQQQEVDEGKAGGFAGNDTKKRRGRAAPPGRCHSCNRAETPEWRRGPDGARTLCNACGLHYAKLTRKNNGTNKNIGAGSSNLRPKENMP